MHNTTFFGNDNPKRGVVMFKKQDKARNKPKQSEIMLKPREIIPIMAQSADPLGSYTGVVNGKPYEKPVQDADDL